MIYYSGLDSVIESIYLNDNIFNKVGSCNIFINPTEVKYIVGKIIIINICDYSNEKINTLLNNKCHIISRTFIDNPNIEVQPYILRICNDIMWNGKVLNEFISLDDILDKDNCIYELENNKLYFPKIYASNLETKDRYENLTVLGWVLQQVGVNCKKNTPFYDLDIIKTKKIKVG